MTWKRVGGLAVLLTLASAGEALAWKPLTHAESPWPRMPQHLWRYLHGTCLCQYHADDYHPRR